ncbi:hypothetical protein SAMN02910456_01991 [Ruminococcaceae bacterium YRB3002]|nr:hypothetical protein SAMN02910456_01991 [Ruminococcaceae bacterium YRB3002]
MNNDNTIFVTLNKLMDFAKFAADWNDIAADCDADPMADVEFEGTYPLSLADVKEALEYVRDDKLTNDKFLLGWWFPLILKCDEALMIRNIFSDTSSGGMGQVEPILPVTEDDMLVYVLDLLADYSNSDYGRVTFAPVVEYLDVDAIIREIEAFEEEEELPVDKRHYSERIRERFIMQYDNEVLLKDSDDDTRRLWRRFTDELVELGNPNAIRIKAYACYGGNVVYKCDWKESARLLDILWREHSFGQAANTLGYIYYYGRLDPDGKPDYEKAFFYFSIGSTYGIVESKYKLADMFAKGQYVARNNNLARSMIQNLYSDTKVQFEGGDYGCDLADVAFRMGKLHRDISMNEIDPAASKGSLELAKCYLLIARLAIDMRIEHDYAYGDEKVRDNINEMLARVSEGQPTTDKRVYHSFNPIYAMLFINSSRHSSSLCDVTIKYYKNGNVGFTVKLRPSSYGGTSKALMVQPWFNECVLTDHISFKLADVAEYYPPEVGGSLTFAIDKIQVRESVLGDGFVMDFCREGNLLYSIEASEIVYKRYGHRDGH